MSAPTSSCTEDGRKGFNELPGRVVSGDHYIAIAHSSTLLAFYLSPNGSDRQRMRVKVVRDVGLLINIYIELKALSSHHVCRVYINSIESVKRGARRVSLFPAIS